MTHAMGVVANVGGDLGQFTARRAHFRSADGRTTVACGERDGGRKKRERRGRLVHGVYGVAGERVARVGGEDARC